MDILDLYAREKMFGTGSFLFCFWIVSFYVKLYWPVTFSSIWLYEGKNNI